MDYILPSTVYGDTLWKGDLLNGGSGWTIIRPIQPFLRPPYSPILGYGKGRTRHSYQLVRYWSLNGTEFVRRARRYARKTDLEMRFDPSRGNGSHGLLYVGQRRTVVKRGELKPGTFRAMLKQLGISEKDF